MRVEITRELKIKLLQALKNGFIETMDFPELKNPDNWIPDDFFKTLTDEERAVLLGIGERMLDYTCK